MKNIKLILFAVFAIVSVAAPFSIIWKHEAALRYGKTYKFRTAPIDPYDAFRGKYVRLSFEDDRRKKDFGVYAQHGYVRLTADADGFAKPAEISETPLKGDDVIRVDRVWSSWNNDEKQYRTRIDYPFNRYYLPEDIAPLAERLYHRANTRAADGERKLDTYVTVKVYQGVGVLEELYLNGVPVREAVKAELARETR
ncbi:MAG: GDYXXLXY domain-containing protein [Verrucomicrobiales bacterium]|jgi:uncharacterized membrane-anchored protein|nr:GDYXXLXY domain-containing protein [Verrucomicrobiales bacterium]